MSPSAQSPGRIMPPAHQLCGAYTHSLGWPVAARRASRNAGTNPLTLPAFQAIPSAGESSRSSIGSIAPSPNAPSGAATDTKWFTLVATLTFGSGKWYAPVISPAADDPANCPPNNGLV